MNPEIEDKNLARQIKIWGFWITGLAALILLITQGMRQTMSLFVEPLLDSTSLDIVSISLALAFNQLLWGIFQPIMGAVADKKGPLVVLIIGSLILAAQQLAVIWVDSSWGILLVWGVMAPAGAAAGGFSILMALTARLPQEKRSMASGIINSGASLGQFLFAPMVQFFISTWGYVSALIMLAGWSLANIPLVGRLFHMSARPPVPLSDSRPVDNDSQADPHDAGLKAHVLAAFKKPAFWLLNGGFLAGGIHVGFIITHLPNEANVLNISASLAAWSLGLIGLFNIAGSLLVGAFGNRFAAQKLLATIYLSRALLVGLYLLAPKSGTVLLVIAICLGINWLSTIPPTVGLMARLCGMRYFATLFGISLLGHQAGAFLGAWLGGAAMRATGDYAFMWHLCIATSILAALCSWLVCVYLQK